MDEQGTEVSIPALADAQELGFAAARILPRHQTEPGRNLPPTLEGLPIAQRGGHRRRRDGANAGYPAHPSAERARLVETLELGPVCVHLPVQLLDLLTEIGEQLPRQPTQTVLTVFQDLRQTLTHLRQALTDDDAVLTQEPPQLIDLGRALLYQTTAYPVQGQNVLLLNALYRYKAHGRTPHRLTYRLGVIRVILIALHIGFDELRADEPGRMPLLPKLPRPIVRPGTGLKPNQTGRQIGKEDQHLRTLQLLAQRHLARFIHAVDLKHVLCNV